MRMRLACLTALAALSVQTSYAGDWPQWRGPNRDGVAPDSPLLIDAIGEGALRRVWESEAIPGANLGGFGQVAVAEGRVFVLVHDRREPALKERIITRDALTRQGWFPDLPPELAKAVEDARLSEARAKLKDQKDILTWADEWLRADLKPEWGKFHQALRMRLALGAKDKGKALCVDLETGKTAWSETIGAMQFSSPVIAEGKVLVEVSPSLYLIRATPDGYQLLGKADLKLPKWITPTIADGRLYLRTLQNVACYDIRARP